MIRAVVFDLWNTLLFSPAGSPFQRLKGLLRPDQAPLHGAMMRDGMLRPYDSVEAFLAGRISFHQIASMVEAVCEAAVRRNDHGEPATVGDALEIDRMTRRRAREALM